MQRSDSIPWNPATRVSFPRPDPRAQAKVQFEHDGVPFATAECWDGESFGNVSMAYFVQDNIPWGDWHRISKSDFEMIVARCKADPTSKLRVASCNKHHLTFVFWPAGVDTSNYTTWQVFDPGVDEERVTFIKARILEHREPPERETAEGPSAWESIPEAVVATNEAR